MRRGAALPPAAWRKQSRQRQSSLAAFGTGNRVGSAAHQHSPPMPQSKAALQRAHVTRRNAACPPEAGPI
jgi:hypothetical protein